MITPRDEALLGWYFSAGQCAFERSSMGAMLERAQLFGHAGTLVYSERTERYELSAERIRRDPTPWARVHDGALVYSGRELTARPTAETRSASGYTPDLADLDRYAEVSRVLCAVERKSALAVAVLAAYFGDAGCEAARTPKPGRIAALYALTSAGVQLLRDSAAEARSKGQPVEASVARRMANELARSRKSERVRVALLRCERQALELRRGASEAWAVARVECRAGRAA